MDKWKQHAACAGKPLSWFFEDYEDNNEIQLIVDSLCSGCAVQRECADYAIATKAEGGVFGRRYFDFKKSKQKKLQGAS